MTEAEEMFRKRSNPDYWRRWDSSPREFFSSLKKAELFEYVATPLTLGESAESARKIRAELRKLKKAGLRLLLIRFYERKRMDSLNDRRGAIEAKKRRLAARELDASGSSLARRAGAPDQAVVE